MGYGLKYGTPQEVGFQPDGSYVPNEYYMNMAIEWGARCVERGQHPVGAVMTRVETLPVINVEGKSPGRRTVELVAGVGMNEVDHSTIRHAEVVAMGKAEMYHGGRRRLANLQSVLYTTHEPCPMCAGMIANSKIKGIVYGTGAEDALHLSQEEGIKWRSNRVSGLDIIRGRIEAGMPEQFIIGGFMRDRCLELLKTAGKLSIA
jgi:tRNA(Arg) A34 adenosine deaminase TadA